MPVRRLTITHVAAVPFPPATTYAVIADARRRPEWMPELGDTQGAPAELQAGDRFDAHSTVLFHELSGHSQVLAADGQTLCERVVVGVAFTSTWTVIGDRVEHTLDVELPGGPTPLSWIEGRLLAWRLRRLVQRSLQALARLQV